MKTENVKGMLSSSVLAMEMIEAVQNLDYPKAITNLRIINVRKKRNYYLTRSPFLHE